jgi:hypothetical protein
MLAAQLAAEAYSLVGSEGFLLHSHPNPSNIRTAQSAANTSTEKPSKNIEWLPEYE